MLLLFLLCRSRVRAIFLFLHSHSANSENKIKQRIKQWNGKLKKFLIQFLINFFFLVLLWVVLIFIYFKRFYVWVFLFFFFFVPISLFWNKQKLFIQLFYNSRSVKREQIPRKQIELYSAKILLNVSYAIFSTSVLTLTN